MKFVMDVEMLYGAKNAIILYDVISVKNITHIQEYAIFTNEKTRR